MDYLRIISNVDYLRLFVFELFEMICVTHCNLRSDYLRLFVHYLWILFSDFLRSLETRIISSLFGLDYLKILRSFLGYLSSVQKDLISDIFG